MVETEKKFELKQEYKDNLACFVLLEDEKQEKKPWFLYDLLGKPVFGWVTSICPSFPVTIECKPDANVLNVIKPFLKDKELTLVLYGDTPLITKETIVNALDVMESENLNVYGLKRGFIFRTEYIKHVDEIYATQTYKLNEEEFIKIDSQETLNEVKSILKNKILSFHEKNGVEFIDKTLSYVECDVRIGGGAVIYPFVSLIGKSQIYKDAVIGNGSVIENSKIESGVIVSGAKIYNSTIKENSSVKESAIIDMDSFVGANSHIGADVVLSNSSVAPNVTIGDGAIIKNAKVYSSVKIGEKALVLGSEEDPVRIGEGEEILPQAFVNNGKKS